MAWTADKELLCNLTNTNSTLTGQLATKDKVIAALKAQLRNSNNNNAQAPAPAPAHRHISASDKKNITVGRMECEYPATTKLSIVVIQGRATKARQPGITR
jgi:hypothetical protein